MYMCVPKWPEIKALRTKILYYTFQKLLSVIFAIHLFSMIDIFHPFKKCRLKPGMPFKHQMYVRIEARELVGQDFKSTIFGVSTLKNPLIQLLGCL